MGDREGSVSVGISASYKAPPTPLSLKLASLPFIDSPKLRDSLATVSFV